MHDPRSPESITSMCRSLACYAKLDGRSRVISCRPRELSGYLLDFSLNMCNEDEIRAGGAADLSRSRVTPSALDKDRSRVARGVKL